MFRKMLTMILTSVVITLIISLGLIVSQSTTTLSENTETLDFSGVLDNRETIPLPEIKITARDGAELSAFHQPSPKSNKPLLVLVHGSGWHGMQFFGLANALIDDADIIIVNVRGHGFGPEPRGDISYINQLEDDLSDVISAYAKPGQKVVLGGHSSGGGLVVRFAGGAHRDMIDGAVLLAPFLKYNAPTTRPNSGGWAHVLTRRMIGLSMLNMARITALNHLTVIQFAMPKAVLDGPLGHTATTQYSFRLNTGYAPRNAYQNDIAALPRFVLITGDKDEAFFAEKYELLMSTETGKGQYHVIKGAGHLGIVDAPQTVDLITKFLFGPFD